MVERDLRQIYLKGRKTKHTDEKASIKHQISHYHLSKREDRTTETEDSAIAAEPIHGCNTRPTGRNTPVDTHASYYCCA